MIILIDFICYAKDSGDGTFIGGCSCTADELGQEASILLTDSKVNAYLNVIMNKNTATEDSTTEMTPKETRELSQYSVRKFMCIQLLFSAPIPNLTKKKA